MVYISKTLGFRGFYLYKNVGLPKVGFKTQPSVSIPNNRKTKKLLIGKIAMVVEHFYCHFLNLHTK
jgi:hypothetical protein